MIIKLLTIPLYIGVIISISFFILSLGLTLYFPYEDRWYDIEKYQDIALLSGFLTVVYLIVLVLFSYLFGG